jgi:multidrug efflux pump subunit AcrB
MAQEESAVLSNVILVLLLVAVVVMGTLWLYRQLGPGAAPEEDRGPGLEIDLNTGGGAEGTAPSY